MSLEDIKKRWDGTTTVGLEWSQLLTDVRKLITVAEATSNYIHNAPLIPNDKLDAAAWRRHMRESLDVLEKE